MHGQRGLAPLGKEAFSLLVQFYEYDRNVPLDARVVREVFIREKVVFRGVRDSLVPGYLGIPTPITSSCPCILLIHGLGASKEDWWRESSDEERLTEELLSCGYCVMALDIEYHGERTQNNDHESPWSMDETAKECLSPVAPRNFAPAIKQTAFLMLNGKDDPWSTMKEVRELHGLVGSPSKELVFFDSGHRLPAEFVPKAVEWFRRHLK